MRIPFNLIKFVELIKRSEPSLPILSVETNPCFREFHFIAKDVYFISSSLYSIQKIKISFTEKRHPLGWIYL